MEGGGFHFRQGEPPLRTFRVKFLMAPLMAFVWAGTSAQEATDTEMADGGRFTQLDKITVTAQKREEDLDKVPLSVSAISGDELSRRGPRTYGVVLGARW